ncbi:MAG TPA: aminotransferase class I/II-fold pyridoxal phosphate-dependent enzyme [Candidatus Lokiarchaeia archaeon]|nr:aminotransferase class I/II-fold pyridoxal phosphate-dependent enzyme [Candidatus Lokiarchaeia archaeon]
MEFTHIQQTPLWEAFSKLARRISLPDGIFYWSGRAKKEADINATIGSAYGTNSDLFGNGDQTWTILYVKYVTDLYKIPPQEIAEYAPIGGLPELRQSWKNWIIYKCQNGAGIDVKPYLTSPLITAGVTDGLAIVGAMFLDAGDHIILPDKYWENYALIYGTIQQGEIQYFPFFLDGKFNLDGMVDRVRASLEEKSKAVLLLNFPNNPTGFVPTIEDYRQIAERLSSVVDELQKPLVLVSDDAYDGYTYDDNAACCSIFPYLVNQSPYLIPIKLDGVSKEMLMYGGRVGAFSIGIHPNWVDGSEKAALEAEINNKLEGYIRGTISNTSRSNQYVINDLLINNMEQFLAQRDASVNLLRRRYELINKLLKDDPLPNATVDPNNGGFFLFVNVEGRKASDVADQLLKQEKVGVIPFETPEIGVNGLRVAYCSVAEEDIPRLVDALRACLS